MAGHGKADGVGLDQAARSVDATHAPCRSPHAGDFAVLDDIHTGLAGRARVAPRHRIVAHGAAARLQKSAQHRVAAIVQINQRCQQLDRFAVHRHGVHAEQPHQVGAPGKQIALRLGVEQVERAALADHGVEIQPTLQPLPQFQRVLIEADIVRQEVIRADDGGITADVTESDRTLLQHRHIADAEFTRQVIRGRQAVAAAADDHHPVARPRRGLGPGAAPAALTAQTLDQQPPPRVAAAGFAFGARGHRFGFRHGSHVRRSS